MNPANVGRRANDPSRANPDRAAEVQLPACAMECLERLVSGPRRREASTFPVPGRSAFPRWCSSELGPREVHPQQAAGTASVTPPGARESLSPSTLSVGCTASSPEQALEIRRPSAAGHEHDRGRARKPRALIGATEKTRGPPPSSHRTTDVAARDHVVSLSRRRNGCFARWPSRAMTSGRRRSLAVVRSPNQMSHEALRSRQKVSRDGSPPWAPVSPPTTLSSFLPRGRGRRATPGRAFLMPKDPRTTAPWSA